MGIGRTIRQPLAAPTRSRAAVFVLAAVAAVLFTACSGGGGQDAQESHAEHAAAAHLDRIGVKTTGGTCDTQSPGRFVCELTTPHDTKVGVAETTVDGKPYYETLTGLFDGKLVEQRLTLDYGRQLHTIVSVRCPSIIEGNVGDTSRCTVTDSSQQAHEVTIKILDDRTGDYTVVGSRSVAQ